MQGAPCAPAEEQERTRSGRFRGSALPRTKSPSTETPSDRGPRSTVPSHPPIRHSGPEHRRRQIVGRPGNAKRSRADRGDTTSTAIKSSKSAMPPSRQRRRPGGAKASRYRHDFKSRFFKDIANITKRWARAGLYTPARCSDIRLGEMKPPCLAKSLYVQQKYGCFPGFQSPRQRFSIKGRSIKHRDLLCSAQFEAELGQRDWKGAEIDDFYRQSQRSSIWSKS